MCAAVEIRTLTELDLDDFRRLEAGYVSTEKYQPTSNDNYPDAEIANFMKRRLA